MTPSNLEEFSARSRFLDQLHAISPAISRWAQERFAEGESLRTVHEKLTAVTTVARLFGKDQL